jgi:hypothetical protein
MFPGRCPIEPMQKIAVNLLFAVAGVGLLAACVASVQYRNKVRAERTQAVSSKTLEVAPASVPSTKIFLERLRTTSGKEANECGTTTSTQSDPSVSACGLKAFKDHKAFFLGYYTQYGEAVWFVYGLAANSAGSVFAVTYQLRAFPAVAPTRHTQLMDDNHIRMTECIEPVILGKTSEGLLACVTAINREESDKVADQKPVDTTVCTVLENPAAFNNKLVRIRGHFSGNFEYSMLSGDDCDGSLWFAYGDSGGPPSLAVHVSGGARPGSEDSRGRVILPIPVSIVRDVRLKRFEKQTRAMAKADADYEQRHPNEFVSHCVTATFIGRIDAVSPEIHEFRKKQKTNRQSDYLGFGHMGLFEAQLVTQSVLDDALLGRCKN